MPGGPDASPVTSLGAHYPSASSPLYPAWSHRDCRFSQCTFPEWGLVSGSPFSFSSRLLPLTPEKMTGHLYLEDRKWIKGAWGGASVRELEARKRRQEEESSFLVYSITCPITLFLSL